MRRKLFGALVIFVFTAQSLSATAAPPVYTSFPDTTFRVEHVTVIDGLGTPAKRDWTVLVKDGRIAEVAPASAVSNAGAIRSIDGRGKTLIPGIVGLHEHLYYEVSNAMESSPTMPFSAPKLYLAAGVTTARTTGSLETYAELNLKNRIDSGEEPGPELDVSGPYLSGPHEPLLTQYASLSSAQDARETVDFWTARGVTSFKAFLALTRDELKATIEEAHARGALVEGHLCSVTMSEAADLGIDELEHGIVQSSDFVKQKKPDQCPPFRQLFQSYYDLQPDDPRIATLIEKLVDRHVAVTSTLAVIESGLDLSPAIGPEQLALLNADALKGYEDSRTPYPGSSQAVSRHVLDLEMSFERAFVAAGGLLTEGADTGPGVLPGFSDERNIELLTSAGFSPVQAIQIATSNGARAMRRFNRIGSIERGKDADMVLLDGDLETDVRSIERPVLVVRRGVAYDPQLLLRAVKGRVGSE